MTGSERESTPTWLDLVERPNVYGALVETCSPIVGRALIVRGEPSKRLVVVQLASEQVASLVTRWTWLDASSGLGAVWVHGPLTEHPLALILGFPAPASAQLAIAFTEEDVANGWLEAVAESGWLTLSAKPFDPDHVDVADGEHLSLGLPVDELRVWLKRGQEVDRNWRIPRLTELAVDPEEFLRRRGIDI